MEGLHGEKLLVIHEDSVYALRLASALCRILPEFRISVEYADEGHFPPDFLKISGIVVSGAIIGEAGGRTIGRTLYIVEEIPERKAVEENTEGMFLHRYQKVSSIASKIRAVFGPSASVGASLSDIHCTAFMSACGGSGTTAAALTYGRIMSRIYGKAMLYITLARFPGLGHFCATKDSEEPDSGGGDEDGVFEEAGAERDGRVGMRSEGRAGGERAANLRRAVFDVLTSDGAKGGEVSCFEDSISKDRYGLHILCGDEAINPLSMLGEDELSKVFSALAACGSWDGFILDLPCDFPIWKDIADSCESIVLNLGWQEGRKEATRSLGSIFERDRVFLFEPMYDEFGFLSSETDMHGQFGGEVRALAERILRD